MTRPATRCLPPLFALLMTLTGGQALAATSADRYVDVSGEGQVHATPDRFTVTTRLFDTGKTAAPLKKTVDEGVKATLKLTDRLHIQRKDVHAAEIRISPRWRYPAHEQPVLEGYEVSREVTVTCQGLDQYTGLVSGLADLAIHKDIRPAGGEISNLAALQRQALEKAVEDARDKARVLARAAGETLGPVLHIEETGGSVPPRMPVMQSLAAKSGGSSYNAGESTVSKQVRVRFALEH